VVKERDAHVPGSRQHPVRTLLARAVATDQAVILYPPKAGRLAGFVHIGLGDLGAESAGDAEGGNVAHIDDEVGTLMVGVVSQEAE
jgi:hypothetical protein